MVQRNFTTFCYFRCSNELLLFWDKIEEYMPLTTAESNVRDIIKTHLLKLLQIQMIYWKQRATIRWVKFGEANTKYFQAKATIKHMLHFIDTLRDDQGNIHKDHQNKAHILWQ